MDSVLQHAMAIRESREPEKLAPAITEALDRAQAEHLDTIDNLSEVIQMAQKQNSTDIDGILKSQLELTRQLAELMASFKRDMIRIMEMKETPPQINIPETVVQIEQDPVVVNVPKPAAPQVIVEKAEFPSQMRLDHSDGTTTMVRFN